MTVKLTFDTYLHAIMSSTVYLVTGANRGIGLAITSQLAARPDAIVFAGARDPSRAAELKKLVKTYPGRVHILKVLSADRTNNDEAAQEIKKTAGRLDVVIANAGISDCFKTSLETQPEDMIRHFDVNTNGPLVLFQATYELLRASPSPKFVSVSSGNGSIAIGPELPVNVMAYGMSKAALNWVTRKLHRDFPDMIIFPINPGGADTDMAKGSLERDAGMKALIQMFPLITADESARGILEQIDVATRDTHGGQFVDYTGLGKWVW
ncbi:hypothetical protein BD626DRAFT_568042 [Schizophyllum amplum]|uniref:NAD(P)-binding protein n=1 Tax=Schizophyllum amplum TaxID=97359 RepID=A0A550CHI0_9AGAR|nr:hypothetical protein BD626DRAFT_568042 [Auriculariopsis ampla]